MLKLVSNQPDIQQIIISDSKNHNTKNGAQITINQFPLVDSTNQNYQKESSPKKIGNKYLNQLQATDKVDELSDSSSLENSEIQYGENLNI